MQELGNRKIANVFSMSSGLSVEDFGWGTATFHKMVSLQLLANPILLTIGIRQLIAATMIVCVSCRLCSDT